MSLINEALKRTRDAAYQTAAASPADAPSYRLVSDTPRRFATASRVVLSVLAVGLGLAAFGFLRTGHLVPVPAKPVGTPASTPARPEPLRSADGPRTAANTATPPPPLAEETKPAEPLALSPAATVPSAAPVVVAGPPPKPVQPALKLQGIMRDGRSFEAMINGYSYHLGDDVEGCKITAIEEHLVHLDFHGEEVLLRLR